MLNAMNTINLWKRLLSIFFFKSALAKAGLVQQLNFEAV